MKVLTLITLIILIAIMVGCKEKDQVNRLIRDKFNDELTVKKFLKEYPSESLKKWEGNYRIILTDKMDKEDFQVNYNNTSKLEEVLKEILLKREEKNKFVKKQKVAVENIKKSFEEPFIQMLEIDTAFGSSSSINFFLEKNFFKENKEDMIKEFLIKVDINIMNSYNRVFISGVDKNFKIEKNYYGYVENDIFYRMNESSFGSDADFYISKIKFNSSMYSLNKDLREKFIKLNDKISINNYFYKTTGLFIEILETGIFYSEIEKKLKIKMGKEFDFVIGYLDKFNDKTSLKGIGFDNMINPTKVYEIIYVFQTEELIFIEK